MFSGEPRNRKELIDELRTAQANGLMSIDTLTMVEGAIKVTELSVDDVMVPRAQIVMVPTDGTLHEVLATVVESGHSRFPVHGEDKDEILGILLAKDLLRGVVSDNGPGSVRELLRPAVLIPESKKLNGLPARRVTRPGKWGNPFTYKAGTRAEHVVPFSEVLPRYEAWLREQPEPMAAIGELRGKVLGCWCAPGPCHGDVLARIADEQGAGR